MSREDSEQLHAYSTSMEQLRVAQNAFAHRRSDLVAARERVNRLRLSAKDAETQAAESKERWNEAFRETDGVLNPELKALRSTLRDAQDLAEEFRNLVDEAQSLAVNAEVPALLAAKEMNTWRRTALQRLAEIELQKAIAQCAPILARAFQFKLVADTPDDPREPSLQTFLGDEFIGMAELRNAVKAIDPESIEMPEELARPGNIAPLQWKDTRGVIAIQQRQAAAAAQTSTG